MHIDEGWLGRREVEGGERVSMGKEDGTNLFECSL